MPYDPSLPAANSPVSSAELRAQFNGLKTLLDGLPTSGAMSAAIAANSSPPVALAPLNLTVSNPPTQAQVQALANKLDELINALISRA
jgi:hypothetical protein